MLAHGLMGAVALKVLCFARASVSFALAGSSVDMTSIPLLLHQNLLYAFAIVSLTANVFLIYLVIHPLNRNLGNYRVLLCTFATVDIVISLYHAAIIPEFAVIEYGFAVFAYNALYLPSHIGNPLVVAYIVLFYEPFILLTFHFFYRLLSVISPEILRAHFKSGIAIAIIINIGFSMIILMEVWISLKDTAENYFADVMLREFGVDLNAVPKPNLDPVQYFHTDAFGGGFNWDSILAMNICGSIGAFTIFFNATCAFVVAKRLDKIALSIASRTLHVQLLRALVVQFVVPVILCVLPFFVAMGLPLTGRPFVLVGNIMSLFVSFFPVVDPICMILAYSKFRRALVDGFRRLALSGMPTDMTTTTFINSPPHVSPSAIHHNVSMAHILRD